MPKKETKKTKSSASKKVDLEFLNLKSKGKEGVSLSDSEKEDLETLLAKGKDQGYLTLPEINESLGDDTTPDQIESIIDFIGEIEGIPIYESEEEPLVLGQEPSVEEGQQSIAAISGGELGRTTDPVRMYMREMGHVELLTREGEIDIAKRIEEGTKLIMSALSQYPPVIDSILADFKKVLAGKRRISDLLSGFIDEDGVLEALKDREEESFTAAEEEEEIIEGEEEEEEGEGGEEEEEEEGESGVSLEMAKPCFVELETLHKKFVELQTQKGKMILQLLKHRKTGRIFQEI
jgi:RNA polymerase primary sigma factor